MNHLKLLVGTLFLSVLYSCQAPAPGSSSFKVFSENKIDEYLDQSELLGLVVWTEIAEAGRSLVHVSHVCNLTIGQEKYLVVDMRELTKGAVVPRGLNQIVVLNRALQLVNQVEYGAARPLFCEGNKLYLYDKLYLHDKVIVDGQSKEGNVLMFDDFGFGVVALEEDLNDKLPL